MTDLLRITEIKTVGLFGLYNHTVPLSMEDRVTIIHGPNGIGKTALLRLVDTFIAGNYFYIYKIPFQSFQLTLSDGSIIGVRKDKEAPPAQTILPQEDDEEVKEGINKITFFRELANGEKDISDSSGAKFDAAGILRRLDSDIPWITRVGKNQWVDRRTDIVYSPEELITNFGEELSPTTRKRLFSEPVWLAETRKRIRVHLIETQRLLRIQNNGRKTNWQFQESRDSIVTTVQNYARELQERVTKALAEYAKTSQSLDQSFPQRLLSGKMPSLDVASLKVRMEEIEGKRSELQKIGLLDEDTSYPFDITTLDKLEPAQRAVMTLYAEDTAQKLGVLNDLSQRLNLLLANLNKKFRNKQLEIDRKNGLVAKDANAKQLSLDLLSSGEQHELVLIYDLLFRVSPNTMVLIDEPELSLHISWQKAFLTDLLEIVHTANFDVLLATHSPFIAGDRADLMLALANAEKQVYEKSGNGDNVK